uniref:DNA polymerase epsilon subunit 3 n=1 Tax=Romanomermis culicivorax TaxID=13658 RepID=A0A915IHW1_ROMCU
MAEKTEDLNLPLAVVSRIIKNALPDGVNISKEARIAVARAASVFVLYATTSANGYAIKAKRKTLAATDIMQALADMEFEELVEPLQQFLDAKKQDARLKKQKTSRDENGVYEVHDSIVDDEIVEGNGDSVGDPAIEPNVENDHDNDEPFVDDAC